ncbi:MAG: MFS transporter [Parvibaculaceae bacterium]|nr:MFS transporter [Parvibaculaceae bacterium]
MNSSPQQQDGLPVPQRYWAIFSVALAITMAVLDGAIANIALPTITHDLGTSPGAAIWIVNGYQLAVTISLLPLASLGEIFGYARVYRGGLILFAIASLACALSTSLETLTVARILQGFGAAGIMSVNSALIRFIYPRAQLGRAVGIIAMVVAVSSAVGPTVAAAILAVARWQWLFAINVPLGLVAIMVARTLPVTPRGRHRFDWISAGLNAVMFGSFISSIDGFAHGGGLPLSLGLMALAIVSGVLLVLRQLERPSPLLPVDLLRIPIFALSISTSVFAFAAQTLAGVCLPFFLQTFAGRSEVATGLLMTPWPLTIAIVAPIAGKLADRYPAGLLGGAGLLIFALGLLSLGFLHPNPASIDIIWRMALCGVGFGLFQSPNNRAMLSSSPPERSGGASGMLGTARLTGQTTGAALVALIFGIAPDHFTNISLFLGAGFALVAMGLSMTRLAAPSRI